MTKKILVPVDLGHDASWKKVLPEALAEARLRDAELHVLTIVPDYGSVLVSGHFPPDFEEEMLEKAKARLDELTAAEVPSDVRCQSHIAHGHAAEQIIAWADRLGVDLIVMASHRPDALRTLLVGSIADRIVHNASQSVLVVRS